jgi:predicted nucleotidyltransferase
MVTGSLARGDFRRDSDIDLAVEGLSDAQFFAASAEAQRIAGDFPVDVVPIEAGSDAYLQDLRAIGVVLHGPSLQDSGESTDKA